jgi:hypothetical protein
VPLSTLDGKVNILTKWRCWWWRRRCYDPYCYLFVPGGRECRALGLGRGRRRERERDSYMMTHTRACSKLYISAANFLLLTIN